MGSLRKYIAGFTAREMGPLFAAAVEVDNIILPLEFVQAIEEK